MNLNVLNFADNITRLRHEKKVTQEQLAQFVGVTKASVSKWETGQSMPDVPMLPQLAAYFDVSIDDLLGYESILSKEQIQKLYLELAADFARKPYEEVMARSEALVKQYYSCYPFLYQMSLLWMNHYMLAEGVKRQQEILRAASDLCRHITDNCKDIGLCNDTIIVNATIMLWLGKADEVIDIMEDMQNPFSLRHQSDGILIQAYRLMGKTERANDFTQVSMYSHLMSLIDCATHYLSIQGHELAMCEETIRRMEGLADIYKLEKLNRNVIGVFWYQAALMYMQHGRREEALAMLERYVRAMRDLLDGGIISLHGDEYFNRLDSCFEQLDIGGNAPRDRKVIFDSAVSVFSHPAFDALKQEKKFQKLRQSMLEMA